MSTQQTTHQTELRLGFQTHVHGDQSARELYPAIVDLYQAAEELGYDSGWVAQHHFSTKQGRLPSPLVLLSAVAERTRTIRLGTSVIALPFENVVRLAEDAAVLDALSAGRLELGLGSGNQTTEHFTAFNVPFENRHEIYEESLEQLVGVFQDNEINGTTARLSPGADGLVDRLWEGPSSVERARKVAARGNGLALGIGPAVPHQLDLAEAYLQEFGTGDESATANSEPRIAVYHGTFISDRPRRELEQSLVADVGGARELLEKVGWLQPGSSDAELLRAMNVHYGSSVDVQDSVSRVEKLLNLSTDFVIAVQAASTSIDSAIRTLETFARDVAPGIPGKGDR